MALPWLLLLLLAQHGLMLPIASAPPLATPDTVSPNLRGCRVRPARGVHRRAAAAPDPALAAAIGEVISYGREHMHEFTSPSPNVTANLSATLYNTYVFTATQTWHRFHSGDGTVFIDTGDIHQQWLRDSCNQMRVYIPLAKTSRPVADVFVGALKRMIAYFVDDVYASAFNPLPRDQMGDSSLYNQCPKSLECLNCTCQDCAPVCSAYSYQHNFELDSFCFTVDLAHRYWAATKDARAFDQKFHTALKRFIAMLLVEQDHASLSPYRFRTDWTDQPAPNNHVAPPNATAKVGLLWSDSRPSDDREFFNYNIPQNMFATVALKKLAELASLIYNDHALAASATNLSASVNEAIERFGVFDGNLTLPKMYAFEVDGFGNKVLMDDANMPNLLSIPYMEYPDRLGLYADTRKFVLTPQKHSDWCWLQPQLCHGNPYYFAGEMASGLGSGHRSFGLRQVHSGLQCQGDCIWPLGLIMEALTAQDPVREREILCVLIRTTDGQRLMHEGFNMDDPSEYNRDLFGWANSLFASWVLGSTALRDPLAPLVCE